LESLRFSTFPYRARAKCEKIAIIERFNQDLYGALTLKNPLNTPKILYARIISRAQGDIDE